MLQKCSLGSSLSAAHQLSALPQNFMMVGSSKTGRGWSAVTSIVIGTAGKNCLNAEMTKAQYQCTRDPAVRLTNIREWKESRIVRNDRIGEFLVMQNRLTSGNSF